MKVIDTGTMNSVTKLLAAAMREQVDAYKAMFEREQYRKVKLSGKEQLARDPWMQRNRNEIMAQKGLSAWAEYQEHINKLMRRGQ